MNRNEERQIHNMEKPNEIKQMLSEAAKHIHVPITASELDAMTIRLLPYYGKELFSVIMEIGNDNSYMPSGVSIENKVRQAQGKAPIKMLTEELIEKHERELVVSGIPQDKAASGAKFMKQVIARKEEPATPIVYIPEPSVDDLLGDFGTENKALDDLASF